MARRLPGSRFRLGQPNPYRRAPTTVITNPAVNPLTPAFPTPDQQPYGYDPALNAQGQNEGLSYLWDKQDYSRDFNADPNATDAQGNPLGYGRAFHDFGQKLSDYMLGHTRAQQNFDTQRGDIRTNYQRLGDAQTGRAAAMGVSEGGALVQAMQKRTANQGVDIGRVDTAANQENQDYQTNAGNATVDSQGVFHPGTTGRLSEQFQRMLNDANTTQGRKDISHTMFGQQLNSEKAYAGTVPDLPKGIHQYGNDPAHPQFYRDVVHNGVLYHQHQNGHMVPIRKVKKR